MGHTPGPWQAHGWGDAEVEIVGPNDRVVCELAQEYDDHSGAGTNAAIEDDARLIAAAPELYAALQEAVRALNAVKRFRVGDTDSYAIAAQCDKAIAKAEGRT